MFAAMAGVYYSFGMMVSSIPPMVTVVRDDLGISRASMGLALGAWALIYIVSAPPAGRVIDRIGLRWSLALGAAFIVGSGVARAGAQGLVTFWLAIAIFGIGGPLVSAAAPKLVMTWFTDPAERRLAVGLYTAAPALGGVTALMITNSVLLPAFDDWRLVVIAYAMVALLAGLLWLAVSSTAGEHEPAPAHRQPAPGEGGWRQILASRGVQLAFVLGIGIFFVNHGLSGWLPNVLETDSGLSASVASAWVGASTIVGIVAGMLLPRMATSDRRGAVIAGACGIVGLSLALMAVASSASVDVAAVLVVGVRAALIPLVIVVLMEADGVTQSNVGLANGLWFSAVQVGGTSGPLVVGAIGDTSAGFPAALWTLAAILGVLALIAVAGQRWVLR